MRAVLILAMLIIVASPAAAQIRFFKGGQILQLGPTKAERRTRQTGAMMGAMSGRQTTPAATVPPRTNPPVQASGDGIRRDVDRAR